MNQSSSATREDRSYLQDCKPNSPRPALMMQRTATHHRAQVSSSSTLSPTETVVGDNDSKYDLGVICSEPSRSRRLSDWSMSSASTATRFTTPVANHVGVVCAGPSNPTPQVPSWMAYFRYDDRDPHPSKENTCVEIEPVTTAFKDRYDLTPEWRRHAHPEGQMYFSTEMVQGRQYITDANLHVKEDFRLMEDLRSRVDLAIAKYAELQDRDIQVVLNHKHDSYYLVDNAEDRRCIFWVHRIDVSDPAEEVRGMTEPSHLKHFMDYQYWTHWELYPHCVKVDQNILNELYALLVHGETDALTSNASTMAYSVDDLRRLSGLVKQMQALTSESQKNDNVQAFINVAVGRLNAILSNERWLNFHGQPSARLSALESVFGKDEREKPRTYLIKIISPFLFYAPYLHLQGIEKIWIDRRVVEKQWKIAVETLKTEWIEFILYATVLLTANVSFLAIPSVDNGTTSTSIPQITSLLSIIASVGSIVTGLLLVRQHRNKERDSANDVADHLTKRHLPIVGHEPLAIMYSLPYTLLMWGMLMFLIALAITGFEGLTRPELAVVVTAWGTLAVTIVAIVNAGWESHSSENRPLFFRFMIAAMKKLGLKKHCSEEDQEEFELETAGTDSKKKLLAERYKRLFKPFRLMKVPRRKES